MTSEPPRKEDSLTRNKFGVWRNKVGQIWRARGKQAVNYNLILFFKKGRRQSDLLGSSHVIGIVGIFL